MNIVLILKLLVIDLKININFNMNYNKHTNGKIRSIWKKLVYKLEIYEKLFQKYLKWC